MLHGCAGSATTEPVAVILKPVLPAAPSDFGRPVVIPAPIEGHDARTLAAQERAAIIQANGRLTNDRVFYDDVTSKFSSGSVKSPGT